MKLICRDLERICVLHVRGALAAEHVDELQKAVRQRLDGAICDFVFDATEMETIDSAGLEALLQLQDQAGERLGQVRLAGENATLRTILDLTRLSGRFTQAPTVDEAIASLQ